MKNGAKLSLDTLLEEYELEFEDTSVNPEVATLTILYDDMLRMLQLRKPEDVPIFEMLYDGISQHAIPKQLGKRESTVEYMIKSMRQILQQTVTSEDLEI